MFAKTSRSIKIAAAALAIAVSGAAIPGAVTPAEAKRIVIKVHGFHGHHFRHHRHFVPVYLGGRYGGCHWMKVRAINLGSSYWWSRYHACRGF
ncbi:MAG TPA: hypothetical protein PK970_01970 [Hyphomicrobiaceae bacterium]|nr:hypothetical protein [Hyphomicrobiaceae bacterium]